ncbi:HXXEE domain-containing protein [Paenibacillus sp. IITD108]|uniref:HXXEE domain-containing protein n=1 Tax=Paenibacillus sp. IITD108 TaxID=3116649 RepID=UPI002F41C510
MHVLTHVGQSIYLRMYTPGVVSAVILVLPYTLYLFTRLIREELITWELILLSIPVGFLIIPIVLLGHELGKRIIK